MATENFFTWGAGGSKLTPEQIAIARQLLARKGMQGADTSPVQHWSQGAARVADALADVVQGKRLDAQEKDLTDYNAGLIKSLTGGGDTSSPIPMTSAAGEVSASSPAPATGKEWSTIGPRLISDLSKDFQLSPEQAAGVVGQLAHESAGFGTLQEVNPTIPGSRGGYGYAQWTGPRRKDFEAWTAQNNLDPNSYEGNYGFLRNELMNTPEGAVLEKLRGAPDALAAGRVFTDTFLRPGIPNYGSRDAWTQRALAFANGAPATAPGEVASLDPSIGIPMPGAEGQMRASDPSQALPMQAASAPPLPAPVTVSPAPPVASVPVAAPQQIAQAAPPVSGPALADAIRVLSDPRANANTKAIAEIIVRQQQARQQAILEQQIKQSDPGYQADLDLKRLQADQIRNPRISPTDQANIDLNREEFNFKRDQAGLTPDINEYNFYAQKEIDAGRTPLGPLDWDIARRKSSASNTTINNGEGNKFYNKLDEKNAEIFSGLSDTGIQARSTMGQVELLDNLLKSSPTGWVGALKQAAGEWGVNTEGLDDIQAATAVINKLVPQQRQPGSGSMSDQDLALFKQSLPRIINQPGGNQTIINTLKGISQYQMQMGEIADRVADRSLSPEEGRRQIRELPNPLANFKPPAESKDGWSDVPSDIPGVKIRRKN
ncbi:putative tail protein [Rhizobium phage RHph_I3_18]|nr:putative tail protein [Rhizobium phage RHph_I3_18]